MDVPGIARCQGMCQMQNYYYYYSAVLAFISRYFVAVPKLVTVSHENNMKLGYCTAFSVNF